MANCDRRCPVFRQIESIRAKCLDCTTGKEDALFSKNKNTMQCGGRGMIYGDGGEGGIERVVLHSLARNCTTPEVYRGKGQDNAPRSVTPLPPEVEERVRLLLAALIGLQPLHVLVLHHLANGGNLSNFNEYFLALQKQWAKYKHFDKRNTWAIFNTIRKLHPELNVLFLRKSDPRNRNGKATAE